MRAEVRKTLEAVRHELTCLHGLLTADGAAPALTWPLDTTKLVSQIDAALGACLPVASDADIQGWKAHAERPHKQGEQVAIGWVNDQILSLIARIEKEQQRIRDWESTARQKEQQRIRNWESTARQQERQLANYRKVFKRNAGGRA